MEIRIAVLWIFLITNRYSSQCPRPKANQHNHHRYYCPLQCTDVKHSASALTLTVATRGFAFFLGETHTQSDWFDITALRRIV